MCCNCNNPEDGRNTWFEPVEREGEKLQPGYNLEPPKDWSVDEGQFRLKPADIKSIPQESLAKRILRDRKEG